jgi:hypothetical protein
MIVVSTRLRKSELRVDRDGSAFRHCCSRAIESEPSRRTIIYCPRHAQASHSANSVVATKVEPRRAYIRDEASGPDGPNKAAIDDIDRPQH